ncbi:MAG TPA: hypothetical protein VFS21_28065 [Roseiflexaceae bacterium]|nr:hypothetical protein [Roseiflexaceae bacterium]
MRVVEGEVEELLEQGLRLRIGDGSRLTVATAAGGRALGLAVGERVRLHGNDDPERGVFACSSLERLGPAAPNQPRRPWWRFWKRETPAQPAPPAPAQRRNGQPDVSEEPRAQHYSFAHRLLPSLAWQNPDRLRMTLAGDEPLPFLMRLWRDIGEHLPPHQRLDPAGLAAETRSHGAYQILLITLPPPVAITEAYFAACVFGPHTHRAVPLRYFTLEESYSFFSHQRTTVLGEWRPTGHDNLGAGPEPDLDAFYTRICQLLDSHKPDHHRRGAENTEILEG